MSFFPDFLLLFFAALPLSYTVASRAPAGSFVAGSDLRMAVCGASLSFDCVDVDSSQECSSTAIQGAGDPDSTQAYGGFCGDLCVSKALVHASASAEVGTPGHLASAVSRNSCATAATLPVHPPCNMGAHQLGPEQLLDVQGGCKRPRWLVGVLRTPMPQFAKWSAQRWTAAEDLGGEDNAVVAAAEVTVGCPRPRPKRRAQPKSVVPKIKPQRPQRVFKWGACVRCGRAMRLCLGKGELPSPFLGCSAYSRSALTCNYSTRVLEHLQFQVPERIVVRRRSIH